MRSSWPSAGRAPLTWIMVHDLAKVCGNEERRMPGDGSQPCLLASLHDIHRLHVQHICCDPHQCSSLRVFCSALLNGCGTLWHSEFPPATQMSLVSSVVSGLFESCCGPPRKFQLGARTPSRPRAGHKTQYASVYSCLLATKNT